MRCCVAVVIGLVLLSRCAAAADLPAWCAEKSLGFTVIGKDKVAKYFQRSEPTFPKGQGIFVLRVFPHGPVETDLMRLDFITQINKQPVTTVEEFAAIVNELQPGAAVRLDVLSSATPTKKNRNPTAWTKLKQVVIKSGVSTRGEIARNAVVFTADKVSERKLATLKPGSIYATDDYRVQMSFITDYNGVPLAPVLTLRYYGASWLFITSVTLKSDSDKVVIPLTSSKVSREILTRGVEERVSIQPTSLLRDSLLDMLQEPGNPIVRFTGDKGVDDFDLDLPTQLGLVTMIEAFEAFGGTFPEK